VKVTNQKFIIGVFLCLFAFTTSTQSQAATKVTVKAGATCPAAGKTATASKSTFICTKTGKKLVWVLKPKAPAIVFVQLSYGSDIHGSITGSPIQKIEIGTTGSAVTATPSAGYEFTSWSDGNANPTRSDAPKENTTFLASFKQSLVTISYSTDSNGTITGQASQTIAKGSQSASVTATPNTGYSFESWSDGNTNPARTDIATSNLSFSARFKQNIPVPKITGHTIGTMLWSDEFNSTSPAIDSNTWTARNCGSATTNGGSTCVTGEVQYFAPSAVKLDGTGNLTITATHTTSNLPSDAGACGAWSGTCNFVSGRLDTQGKVSFKYGYIEANIKMPAGGGNWPAFWLLGTNINSVGWPTSGEIDIVEAGGDKPTLVHGSLNYKNGGGTPAYVTAIKTSPSDFSAGFHTYGVLWLPNSISFYFDGELYETQTPSTINGPNWSFNAPFFLILNNAIAPANSYYGGNWDGWNTSTMSIDSVRAWQVDGQGEVTKP
jgi:beta-glucanase (GH16 family)